ncbi:MAG: hypothetical protein MJ081_07525 [Ruminococcus sp.]|nr:hypothetical protein [Ruminococcus sp.]
MKKRISMLAACVLMLTGCNGDKVQNVSDNTETTTETTAVSQTTAESTTTAEPTTETVTETETAAETQTPNGCESAIDAARLYYNCYITENYEQLYNLFSADEIKGYHSYIDNSGILGEQKADDVFRKSAVIKAVKYSMMNIRGIMAETSDVPYENWSVTLSGSEFAETGENELAQFNSKLGTAFTAAVDCGYVYYTDGIEEHKLLGNDCSFVEKDGRWYLSYSTYMNAELMTFMDLR